MQTMPKPLLLSGKTFGLLKVIERVENNKYGSSQWLCQCECGNATIVMGSHLTQGSTSSCGCQHYQRDDLVGQKFGRWLVLELATPKGKHDGSHWLCLCECGAERVVYGYSLKNGTSVSCGCYKGYKAAARISNLDISPETGRCSHRECTGRHSYAWNREVNLCPVTKRKHSRYQIRRERRKRASFQGPVWEFIDVFQKSKGICQLCFGIVDPTIQWKQGDSNDWYGTEDHIIPVAKGGPDSFDNVQLAHKICNSRKNQYIK